MSSKRRRVAAVLLLAAAFTGGCNSTKFYERRHLSDKVMTFAEDPTEVHFQQKCFYSREGSAGGIGASAGGGCGCY